jgi:hypothetical protein
MGLPTLNKANGASIPSGVQPTLDAANTWLLANTQAACTANGSLWQPKELGKGARSIQ